jgi:hypothetical protein
MKRGPRLISLQLQSRLTHTKPPIRERQELDWLGPEDPSHVAQSPVTALYTPVLRGWSTLAGK